MLQAKDVSLEYHNFIINAYPSAELTKDFLDLLLLPCYVVNVFRICWREKAKLLQEPWSSYKYDNMTSENENLYSEVKSWVYQWLVFCEKKQVFVGVFLSKESTYNPPVL